jgi:hypothetical protein
MVVVVVVVVVVVEVGFQDVDDADDVASWRL